MIEILFRRFIRNLNIRLSSTAFESISIISEGLKQRFKLADRKTFILPLGAECLSTSEKNFDHFSLIYIGSLNSRRIHETIIGFSKFYHKYHKKILLKYSIIGSGSTKEIDNIDNIIKINQLENVIFLHGRKPHTALAEFLDIHNIGINYIPVTEYFQSQPPTKLFEYLLSGLIIISTDTEENKKYTRESNGVLIDDNPDAFFKGLEYLYHNKQKFDSKKIIEDSLQFSWKSIINNIYIPFIDRRINK
jgi:glycosyltransferase involved in cell wall biosynthesis